VDHFIQIYSSRAADYHRMIAPEDVDGKLLSTLRATIPLTGKRILDLGTGTGRLPLLLAREAAQMVGLDLHWGMLRENVVQRSYLHHRNRCASHLRTRNSSTNGSHALTSCACLSSI
jgi:ubiquinone/menaquinone biosynthesis C-methylase UbiE